VGEEELTACLELSRRRERRGTATGGGAERGETSNPAGVGALPGLFLHPPEQAICDTLAR